MNAVQRFIRSRVLLLTASILIVAMALSVLVQGQSQAALNRTVDQNSRGLYDILVQASPADDGALMQPDIATGQGGIGFEVDATGSTVTADTVIETTGRRCQDRNGKNSLSRPPC